MTETEIEAYGQRLLELTVRAPDLPAFLSEALANLVQFAPLSAAGLYRFHRGKWETLAHVGAIDKVPFELLSEALDRETRQSSSRWQATPLTNSAQAGEVLLAQFREPSPPAPFDRLQAMLFAAFQVMRGQVDRERQIERLRTLLAITHQWHQTQDMSTLLQEMAEASTRLLQAERASIFLWDRPHKTLVGRPALGVEGGELRIADDQGIVGQVVQSGEPRRVDREEPDDEIDRSVDEMLGFQTQTLLCVPLKGSSGELLGAFELINKRHGSFTDADQRALTELAVHAALALEQTQEHEHLIRSRHQVSEEAASQLQMLGSCEAIERLRATIAKIAPADLAVLILGENGTGKEVVAKSIHYQSPRRDEPLIAVNCAAISETLLESELFGHEKGAFTDAHEARAGKFELASGGTLFLDEIGEMSLSGQAKLLRVLEEKTVVKVGGSTPIHTDARVLAATNQNLAEMVREKRFREDLYFRLNVVTLEIPPLRERGEDILSLAEHFLEHFCHKARRRPPRLTAEARRRLMRHAWPGNVRELRNLMERVTYLSTGDSLEAEELAFILAPGRDEPEAVAMDLPLPEATRQFQIHYIQRHIQRCQGNMTAAAETLGLHRSNLYRKMKQLGMDDSP